VRRTHQEVQQCQAHCLQTIEGLNIDGTCPCEIVLDSTSHHQIWCACSKTGSHILEKILQKLGDEAPGLEPATQTAVQQVGLLGAAVQQQQQHGAP
jgi:hypothetical protein